MFRDSRLSESGSKPHNAIQVEIKCPKKEEEVICSNFFKRGKTVSGKQRYTCRNCGITIVETRSARRSSAPSYIACKRCRSRQVILYGKYGEKQRYHCEECGYTFSYN